MTTLSLTSCGNSRDGARPVSTQQTDSFSYFVDRFADTEVLRYQVHGFEELTLQQKKYIYYLSQAAVEGRDILFDQNNQHNLVIRHVLEDIYLNYKDDRNSEDFKQFEIYLKRVWFANGIHHHYSMDKFLPGFSKDFFVKAFKKLPPNTIAEKYGWETNKFLDKISSVIFDPDIDAKRVNQADGEDLIQTSANNYYHFYEDRVAGDLVIKNLQTKAMPLTQQEVQDFYNSKRNPDDLTPVSYGLNSRLVKYANGDLEEQVWKTGGMYSERIKKIVYWLEKAKEVAENDRQKNIIRLLIDYYATGDLKTFDDYSVAWVKDTASHIDFVNGFIETYGDPLGMKASWESVVNFKNIEATKRTETISTNAQWFEDNSPVDERFKKEKVKGVSAKVITVAMLGGDCYPASPMGINLPNANWIREVHGSKSVTLDNITDAYTNAAQGSGFNEEFIFSQTEIDRKQKYGKLVDDLHTDLHECLGHGSGKLLPGISQDALKAYGAVIEEARADLFALYYIADPKMVELGLLPNHDAYKAEYYNYLMNGLMTQLVRIELGKDVEQTHMRNRQMVASWVLKNAEKDLYHIMSTKNVPPGYEFPPLAVEFVKTERGISVQINDYEKLRDLFGRLLTEIQRIKSEGDYEAAKNLVESLGIKIDQKLHAEILERYQKLNIAPYKGFVNPVYTPVPDEKGEIIDIKIDYSEGYVEQMLRYSREN